MFIETKEFPGPSLDVNLSFRLPPMEGTEGEGEQVRLTARATRTQDGVRLEGHLGTAVSLSCARCTGTFRMALETDFLLMYRARFMERLQTGTEIILSPEDCAVAALDEHGRIDVLALAREQVYLALPLKPMCRETCRGLCSQCGVDLNLESCACVEPELDPRLAVLADLKSRL